MYWLIKEKPLGKFYLFWPWNDVRFLPILIAEYLFNNPNSKIAIVSTIKNKINCGDIPSLEEKLKSLAFIDSKNFIDFKLRIDARINKKINHINDKLFKKIFNVNRNMKLEELAQLGFPNNAIYLKKNIWNYIFHNASIHYFTEIFPCKDFRSDSQDFHAAIDKAPTAIEFGSSLLIINSNNEKLKILERIKDFSPDLLLLEGKGLQLITSDLGSSTVLGFSTQLIYRSLYDLKELRDCHSITIHSLDNDIILGNHEIIPKIQEDQIIDFRQRGELYSPLSNHPATIHKKSLSASVEYIPIEEMDDLDEYTSLFCTLLTRSNLSGLAFKSPTFPFFSS